jgi:hypothetical protein
MNSRGMRWVGACIIQEEKRNEYKILVDKPEGER